MKASEIISHGHLVILSGFSHARKITNACRTNSNQVYDRSKTRFHRATFFIIIIIQIVVRFVRRRVFRFTRARELPFGPAAVLTLR